MTSSGDHRTTGPTPTRRSFLRASASAGAAVGLNLAGWGLVGCARPGEPAKSVTLLDAGTQQKFRNPLPKPVRIHPRPGTTLTVPIKATRQWMGLRAPDGSPLMTTVYGFEHAEHTASPGPTIIARSHQALAVEWQNQLPNDAPYLLPIDLTVHIPDVGDPSGQFITQKPLVIHLHGGHTVSESDGNPEAWYTRDYQTKGPDWTGRTYRYANTQEAAGLWYHDHTVGMTRLNVYAGLAGMYLLKDANEDRMIRDRVIPDDDHMIEVVLHDALFDSGGNLYLPGRHGEPIDPIAGKEIVGNWPNPTVFDEFFGTHILANGMAWPKIELTPNRYRLRLLNGSISRTYVLEFANGMEFFQIGSDGGFLNSPVRLTQLVIAPAERMDIIADFTGHAGQRIVLKNLGPELPFRGYVDPADPEHFMKLVYNAGEALRITDGAGGLAPIADPETTGLVMRFDIAERNAPADVQAGNFGPAVSLRAPLRSLPRDNPAVVRQLALFNLRDDMDRTLVLLGSLASGSRFYADEITEVIRQGSTEIWEIYNTTNSAHPIHLHQVQFEIVNRQQFDGVLVHRTQQLMHFPDRTFQGARLELHGLRGDPVWPQPNEQGRKDTAIALAGQVTRVIAHFDLVGTYVWHCHIISHEDYDMMRKFEVTPSA